MQAAALLFMNRPGHRGAASSISNDSISSELVSHSSHDPLLSSRPTRTRTPTPTPPSKAAAPQSDSPLLTLNTLDPAERAALIRQSRKLNKVLGATPHISEAPPRLGTSPRLQHNQHQRRGTIAGPETIRRTSSAGASTFASRGKVSKSLVVSVPDPGQFVTPKAPFLCIATNSTSPRRPASPTLRRRLSDTSIASSATSASFAFAPPSPVPGAKLPTSRSSQSRTSQDSIDLHVSSPEPAILDSQASLMTIQSIDSSLSCSLVSPVFSPRTTEELSNQQRQQTRARMAKLQRLMGENVPSELVLQTTGRPSTGSRRRLSIDLPPVAKDVGRHERSKHKHTKSMWKRDTKDDAGFESAPEPEDQLRSKRGKKFSEGMHSRSSEDAAAIDVLRPPLTEKQKALNVKRAMKMAQVFGVPPPQDLYQIQGSPTGSLGPQNLSRQSLVSLASLAYLLDHDRDSLYDMLASAPELAEEGEDEGPVEWPYERDGTGGIVQDGTVDPQDKATIENSLRREASTKSKSGLSSGRGSPNISSSPLLGVSRASSRSDVNLAVTPPEHSPTSTSGLTKSGSLRRAKSKERIDGVAKLRKDPPPPVPSPPPGTSGPEADFTARRRRANKLSRFFGVGYQDLFNTMLFGIPGTPSGAPNLNTNEESVVPPLPSSQEALPRKSGGGTVVVTTDDGKEIDLRRSALDWSAAVDNHDLKAMMGRLRALKA